MAFFRCFYLSPVNNWTLKWDIFEGKITLEGIIFNFEDSTDCPARQCRLAILCWMDGGNSLQGCGYNPWLYSCCMQNSITTVRNRNPNYNNHLSELKRQDDLQNSFSRRRYDLSENQLAPACGIPSTPSNTLQKRIIGGRPAQFAEFPWQSHIRIKEYQCGGGKIGCFLSKSENPAEKSFISSTRDEKVCCHSGSLCFASEASRNCYLSWWTGYSEFGVDLWAVACGKALRCTKVCPPTLQVQINSTG